MKNFVNKIVNGSYRLLLIFVAICFSISLIGSVFFYVNRSGDYFNPVVLTIGTVVYIVLLYRLYRFVVNLDDNKKNIFCVAMLSIQFVLLFCSSCLISSVPKVDLLHILVEINSLNRTGRIMDNTYFSVYPNNRFLLIILYTIQKIDVANGKMILSLLSSFCITLMSYFIVKTVRMVFDLNKAVLSLVVCVFSPIFYLYVSYYYTDVLMMPFSAGLVYLIFKMKNEERWKVDIPYGLITGVVAIIGYKIRAVSIFVLIAYFVYIIISKKPLVSFRKIVPILIAAVVTLTCINHMEEKFFPFVDEDKKFPGTHWVMMGMNEKSSGFYTQDDYNLSFSAENVSERKKLNIAEIKKRVSDMGASGLAVHLVEKIVVVWGKGDYNYEKYLRLVSSYNKSYTYLLEDKNLAINYVLQFSKIAVLLLSLISVIKLFKRKDMSIMCITLFGSFLFYILWEVAPRYGLSFLPWLIIFISHSYNLFEYEIEKKKIYGVIKYGIFALTVILFAVNFNKCTALTQKSDIVAKDSNNKKRYIILNERNEIMQSLKLSGRFNQIKLHFKAFNGEDYENTLYHLELLNDKQEVLYHEDFRKSDMLDDKYTQFNLDKSYDKGNYYLKLTADGEGSIRVCTVAVKNFDFYPEGTLKMNRVEILGDLRFEVINNEMRGRYSKPEYILIILLSLGFELTAFYPCGRNYYIRQKKN